MRVTLTTLASAMGCSPLGGRLRLDAWIAQLADALDVARHHVAGMQEPGRRAGEADAGGRAGEYEVAGPEGDDVGQAADQLGHREDEVGGAGLLDLLAVDRAAELEVVAVGDLVGGHQEWTRGP